ncbi:hypothetical protein HBH98_249890 [Parastagonospora nodorum]|nr:hypothetical protein HBH53_251990 [Parastagonospora nodorum]KAH3956317.1 hypothetical protein HBH51_245510 [Parastagonospora nodorum]KAH4215511.1 hypothetical protein HBI06_248250 [Parastagonospora nodorum]KAH4223585.1 hypothetical protein HBI05_246260 [Parastagonospora nodorum]KAH4333450.1 hypothetical protein HBH98_249890 [Parastagonospora nodorum]
MNDSTPSLHHDIQVGILEQAIAMAGSPGSRDVAPVLALSKVSKEAYHFASKQVLEDLDFTGWKGMRIATTVTRLATKIASAKPDCEQISSIEIRNDDQKTAFSDYVPDGDKDGARRDIVADLFPLGQVSNPASIAMVEKARQDVGYAFNQRYYIDGLILVAAMLCPNLTRLVVDVGATRRYSLAFPRLLSLVLQADQVLDRVRWNNLTYLEVNMDMKANCFLLPRSVKELVVHHALKDSFSTNFPDTTTSESNSSQPRQNKLQRLTIAGGEDAGDMAGFVSALINTGSVPDLAYLYITEYIIDTAATDALLIACANYLGPVLKEITVDLSYRPEDHLNMAQNGNLQQPVSVQSGAFHQLSDLRVARLSRLLLPDISHIGSYLTPQIQTFHVLDAFIEDIKAMVAQLTFHALPSWRGLLILGLDIDENELSDSIVDELSAIVAALETNSAASMNISMNAVGSFELYFELVFDE